MGTQRTGRRSRDKPLKGACVVVSWVHTAEWLCVCAEVTSVNGRVAEDSNGMVWRRWRLVRAGVVRRGERESSRESIILRQDIESSLDLG
jgi:hypothetical protein